MLAAGNLDSWRSTGVVTGKRWYTAQDERVCVICGRLHGRIVEIDQGWTFMPEDLQGEENAELRRALGNVDAITILQPPAHVNCLPGDSLVLSVGGISAASKRWYEGDFVTIHTPENQLTVTPNHPVLTPFGWLPANKIKEGDYVIEHDPGKGESSPFQVNKDYRESPIQDVFSSFGVFGFRMPTAAPDFHNDGSNSDVTVIRTNGQVMSDGESQFTQPLAKLDFMPTDIVGKIPFSGLCPQDPLSLRNYSPLGSGMGSLNLSAPLLGRHKLPFERLGLGLVPGFNAGVHHPPAEYASADTQLSGEAVLALAGNVSLQEVTKIRNFNSACHVYNLQTSSNVYIANGIITHNCRCVLMPFVSVEAVRERRRQRWENA
jgi:hypothetical protein